MTRTLTPTIADRFDMAVIGGGAAGLSAALTLALARARRAVIVIDAGSPRNAPAAGVHGFLSRDGIGPAELLALGRQEVERYGGMVVRSQAEAARRIADGFEVALDDGGRVVARRLVVAPRFVARSRVLESLGLRPSPDPRGVGERIAADPTGRTEVLGVWVAAEQATRRAS